VDDEIVLGYVDDLPVAEGELAGI